MQFNPAKYLGHLLCLLMLVIAFTVIYNHFRGSDDSYPKLEEKDFSILELDTPSNSEHPLITRRKAHEYEITFSRDNPGTVIFSPSSFFQHTYQFKYMFSRNRGIPCEAGSKQDQPFLLNLDIDGRQFSHSSIPGDVATVDYPLSKDDNALIMFDGQDNTCGAAYLVLHRKADYPVILLLMVAMAWMAFISACGFHKTYSLGGFAVIMLVLLSEAESRGAGPVLSPAFLGLSLAPIFAATFLGFLSSIRTRITGIGKFVLLILAIASILAFVTLPVVVVGFEKMFDKAIDRYDWFAIFQTDAAETAEFMSIFAQGETVSVVALVVVGLLILGTRGNLAPEGISIPFSMTGSILSLTVTLVFLIQTTAVQHAFSAFQQYQADRNNMTQALKERQSRFSDSISATKPQQDEIYIVVLGESANKYHFSLYNYPRKTNPRLVERRNRGELIVQENGYSSGISTAGTLPYALTTSYLGSDIPPSKSPAIMEILNLSGVETYWLHNGSTSIRKNTVSIIAEQAQYVNHMLSTLGREDGKLIAEVTKLINSEQSGTRVIFLKTQGSHLDYCERIDHDPETWSFNDSEFDDWLIPNRYPATKVSRSAHCYDGSILYTDFFVDELIKLVESHPAPAAVVYFSDHGDDVVRGTAHMKNPTFDVFNMPMFTYFSPGYEARYPEKVANMKANASALYVNDQVFDTLMGIVGVNTNVKDETSDLTSNRFTSHVLIYRGSKSILDEDNYEYRTRKRISDLLADISEDSTPILALGRIEHPFHLAYVNGPDGYPFVSINVFEQDGELRLGNLSGDSVQLSTAMNYLNLESSRDIFVNFSGAQEFRGGTATLAKKLAAVLSQLNCVSQCTLTVSTDQVELGQALEKIGISVSIVINSRIPDSISRKFEKITVTDINITELPPGLADKELTLVATDCDFLSCGPEELSEWLRRVQRIDPALRFHRLIAAVHKI